jgi:hypothetical protein
MPTAYTSGVARWWAWGNTLSSSTSQHAREQSGCKRHPDLAKGIVRSWSFRLLGRPVTYLGFAEDAKLLR